MIRLHMGWEAGNNVFVARIGVYITSTIEGYYCIGFV